MYSIACLLRRSHVYCVTGIPVLNPTYASIIISAQPLKVSAQGASQEAQEAAGSSRGGSESTRVHSTIREEEGKGRGDTSGVREESLIMQVLTDPALSIFSLHIEYIPMMPHR
jgi:hypothetical protein